MIIDDEYFFIRKNEANRRLPSLQPDTNTAERDYWFEPQPMTSAPLIFINAWRDEFEEQGIKEELADILFEGSNFIVRDPIREALLKLELPHLHMHPAIYIDGAENWHEDYWYVAFDKQFSCWDRNKSTYLPKPVDIYGEKMYEMMTYALDEDLLLRTPQRDRLLFQMGETTTGMIVCHKSIAKLFQKEGKSGAILQPISDY